jgi:hypothetical protein
MIPLINKPNTDPVSGEYPYGNIRDRESGQANGTPVNTEVYADFHQFFEKLMAESQAVGGDAPNELPDNEYNGFQLYAAFVVLSLYLANSAIDTANNNEANSTWTAMTLNGAGGWIDEGSGTYHVAEYQIDPWGWVHLRGKVKSNVATDMGSVLLATLPEEFWPTKKENFVTTWYSPAALGSETNGVTVEADGKITPYTFVGAPPISIDQAGSFLSLDGIRFKIS